MRSSYRLGQVPAETVGSAREISIHPPAAVSRPLYLDPITPIGRAPRIRVVAKSRGLALAGARAHGHEQCKQVERPGRAHKDPE